MSNNSINPRNPLLIPELFQCVLECLVTSLPQRPSKEERRTLAVLARTCRTLSEPSLNCLWRRLNSLLPLVRCFADVADEARVKTPPSTVEWLAINQYASRIQELTLGNERLSLHFLQRTGLVLPNLRVFRWQSRRGSAATSAFPFDSIAFLWPLLTPKIDALEVQLDDSDDPNYQLFLENYPLLCPNLTSIKFNFFRTQGHQTVSQALSKAMCSNARWQHVELSPPIDNVVLNHLGMSSTLKTASLTLVRQTSRPDETCFGPEDTPFRSVRDLTLILWNSLDFATCLLRPRDQAFHSFEVILHTVTVATEVSDLLTALASLQRTHSLQSIGISHIHLMVTWAGMSPGDRHRQPLSYETFRPLVSLVHLRRLVINLNHPTSLDDEEFAGLVRNWPFLEILQMMWAPGEDPAASITLKGLLLLLVSCRKLRAIGLTLDARDVPVGAYADVCSPFITSPIQFHNSQLKEPNLVAEFLMKHLPSVPGVSHSFTWRALGAGNPMANNLPVNFKPLEYQQLWMQVNNRIGHPPFSHSSRLRNCSQNFYPIEEDYY